MASAIAQEIEAKLLARDVSVLDRIAAQARIGAYRLQARKRARLETIYLDTDDFALLAAGACLRVRKDGRRFEATAKWLGEVERGLHTRPELTVVLPRAAGDPRRALRSAQGFELPQGPLRDQLVAIVAGRALRPILTTHIDRRVIDVVRGRDAEHGGAVAELALDRVRAQGPDARVRAAGDYAEVELELREGTLAELRTLSAALRRRHALVATRDTKLSRGLALVYGRGLPRPAERSSSSAHAKPNGRDSVGSALRQALGAQLARIVEHDPGTRAGRDPEALHQQRVGVRRCRAVLRALGSALPPRRTAHLQRELRWLGRALGSVRDLDVQLEGYAQIGRALPEPEQSAVRSFVEGLRVRRTQARESLARVLESARYFDLLSELRALSTERAEHVGSAGAGASFALVGSARAERALRRLRRRGRALADAAPTPRPDALHALRIRARRTRYLLELLEPLGGAPARRVIEHLVRIQDSLGAHQDAIVARVPIAAHRHRQEAYAPPAVLAALKRLEAHQDHRVDRALRDFARAFGRFDRDFRDVERMLARTASASRLAKGADP